jgi:ABC-type polysaccharide/polyol phosphate transport system ATPase subunit
MARPAVVVEDLAKRYRLGEDHRPRRSAGAGDATLVHALAARARGRRPAHRDLWALDGVDLSVAQGEVVGFIGRNGSGKSTLLKILARITAPTRGRVLISGRVGALLEVGTGFHPELTGRENISLNGALLGLTRREIRQRFDEIVAFAEIGSFLDTPVKRYSSGMQLRLAFSVAAHLEPDVLIVDEVLAVGDAEFQARCLGRMSEFHDSGRTILFVSHDLGVVRSLCDRAVWLAGGRVVEDGPTAGVVRSYLTDPGMAASDRTAVDIVPRPGAAAHPVRVAVTQDEAGPGGGISRDRPFRIEVDVAVGQAIPNLSVAVYLLTLDGQRILDDDLFDHPRAPRFSSAGTYRVGAEVPPLLAAGAYRIGVWVGTTGEQFFDEDVLTLELQPAPDDRADSTTRNRVMQPPIGWSIHTISPPPNDEPDA